MEIKKYKFYSNILAWTAFAIALIIYTITLEPTTSFWDCGEFLSSAYKLEVGHPPGAPLFMLIGRFFSLFSSDLQTVAYSINMVSAVAGAFTILFLFWTITYFAEKILLKEKSLYTNFNVFTVLAAGFVGSTAYAFSDTFWFSAVEAEVYSLSSLFTAVVFWAILKWERISDTPYSNRWLVLIAFIMGLSIGVHLLNLLAIPAIVFVYYFKKYEISRIGIIKTAFISIAILLFVLYGIIQGYFTLAAQIELLFVNSFGLPYDSGFLFFLVSTILLLIFAISYTHKNKKHILNTAVLFLTVILIGYSSYAVIYIRSAANTPMDENNPEDIFSLLSYLNREQYGSRPLIWGPYYDAEFQKDNEGNVKTIQKYTYIPQDGKYKKITRTNPKYLYAFDDMTLFPRMYSRAGHHVNSYKIWGNVDNLPDASPNFSNNLIFFSKYQLGQMYFRYFMWNFAGRQNNEQGNGSFVNGNWLSGIPFVDAMFLGPQKNLPDSIKNEKSRNKYYLIPFILGIIGLMFSFKKDNKNAWIITLLFFFTGIAIVLYLNQTPQQPRERDYAYAGSFYAFTIWIGLAVVAIFVKIKEFINEKYAFGAALLIGISAPALMAWQNFDDHNRSGRFTVRDFAKNYLDSCEKNAIIFTYGDNDTFPLWYVQEVENYRTDVKVVNTSLLGTNWYIDQMRRKSYKSEAVPFKMKSSLYVEGSRDAFYVLDNQQIFIDEKYYAYEDVLKAKYNELKGRFIDVLKKSDFSTKNETDFQIISDSIAQIRPEKFLSLLQIVHNQSFIKKHNINFENVGTLVKESETFFDEIIQQALPLQFAMDFLANDLSETKLRPGTEDELNYIPSKALCLFVDTANVLKSGKFSEKEKSKFAQKLEWRLTKNYYYKSDMAILEIIARNNWERPIYFASSIGFENFLGLENYLRLEGFAYRLVPYKLDLNRKFSINTEILYDNLMNKFSWGRMNEEDVFIDNFNRRVINIMDVRGTFLELAKELIVEKENEKAINVLDRMQEILPDSKLAFDENSLKAAEMYYNLGENEMADSIMKITYKRAKQDFDYFDSLKDNYRIYSSIERKKSQNLLSIISNLSIKYKRNNIF